MDKLPGGLSQSQKRRGLMVRAIVVTGILLAVCSLIVYVYRQAHAGSTTVPDSITRKVLFPIYVPERLPPGFRVDAASYEVTRDVLLFVAADQVGNIIVFTEQSKPQDFDIQAFYQNSLNQPQSVTGSSHPSIIGKSDNGNWLLSVQADTTWLIITTKAPNPQRTLEFIAQQLVRQ
jgi:hypothetical protein